MTRSPAKPGNPFHPAVLAAGVLFTVTVCSYGVMVLQHLQPPTAGQPSPAGRWLLELLDQRGEAILAIELVLLAAATLAAMLWDQRRPPPV